MTNQKSLDKKKPNSNSSGLINNQPTNIGLVEKKKPKELSMTHKQYSVLSNKKSDTQPKELEWDRFVKENHTNFSKDANGIKYEFYEDDLLDFINQNYISKQQILNLECLKEEEENWEKIGYEEACSNESRNQLRKEIKEQINKL